MTAAKGGAGSKRPALPATEPPNDLNRGYEEPNPASFPEFDAPPNKSYAATKFSYALTRCESSERQKTIICPTRSRICEGNCECRTPSRAAIFS